MQYCVFKQKEISKEKLVIEHNYAGNHTTMEVENIKYNIKNRTKISSVKPSQIFDEVRFRMKF